jgi:hypothetical protein
VRNQIDMKTINQLHVEEAEDQEVETLANHTQATDRQLHEDHLYREALQALAMEADQALEDDQVLEADQALEDDQALVEDQAFEIQVLNQMVDTKKLINSQSLPSQKMQNQNSQDQQADSCEVPEQLNQMTIDQNHLDHQVDTKGKVDSRNQVIHQTQETELLDQTKASVTENLDHPALLLALLDQPHPDINENQTDKTKLLQYTKITRTTLSDFLFTFLLTVV